MQGWHSPLRARRQQFAEASNTVDRHNGTGPQAAQDKAHGAADLTIEIKPDRGSVAARPLPRMVQFRVR
jgi:hypothetical protein